MLGIEKEAMIFLYACLTGIVLFFTYQIVYWFRKIVPHSMLMIYIEDILFWVSASVYLYRQMYQAAFGNIRWFFVLGVISGALLSYGLIRIPGKIKMKYRKCLEKKRKNR